MPHDVFVSYSSDDKPTADAVCATLESKGIRCWIAPRDILPGADWGGANVDAINASRVMVLVYSAKANDSPQIKREVERAVNRGLSVIPFRIQDVPMSTTLEYFMSMPHWLDALTPPLQQHLDRLADTTRLILERSGTILAAPPGGQTSTGRPAPPLTTSREIVEGIGRWVTRGHGVAHAGRSVRAALRSDGDSGTGQRSGDRDLDAGPGADRSTLAPAARRASDCGRSGE